MKSIFHPYRGPAAAGDREHSAPSEELIFYVALCLIGAIPIGAMTSSGRGFGVEPTIGVLMIAAGIAGLIALVVGAVRTALQSK